MRSSPSPRGSLARLVERLVPGGRLVRMRRLRGGLGARMHVLDIERSDGEREKLVLRRYMPDRDRATPEHVAREFDILRLLESAGVDAPAPSSSMLRASTSLCQAMVLTYLPGASVYAPRKPQVWAERLARGLLEVHAITPDRFDLSKLHIQLIDGIRGHIAEP